MDTLHIKGGRPLTGTIPISGAKNAALPLMTAALLSEETVHLDNVPRLTDVNTLIRLLKELGCEAELGNGGEGSFGKSLKLNAKGVTSTTAPGATRTIPAAGHPSVRRPAISQTRGASIMGRSYGVWGRRRVVIRWCR